MEDEPPAPSTDPPPSRWLKARDAACSLMIYSFAAGILFGLLAVIVHRSENACLLFAGLTVLSACVALLAFLGWWAVLFFGFFKFRFTLRSMLITVLGIGACGSLLSGALGNVGLVVGTILAFLLAGVALAWVGSFDP